MRRSCLVVGLIAMPLSSSVTACGKDSGATADSASESGTGDSGEGGDAGVFTPVPARGLQITGVTASQGVAVPIVSGTDWVGGEGRNTRLVGERNTLIRVHFDVDDDWVPREIECRLSLVTASGEAQDLASRLLLERDSEPRALDTTCIFGLEAALGQTSAPTTFQISVWDVMPGGEAAIEYPTVVPAAGPQLIGFESGLMQIRQVMVPINRSGDTPALAENIQVFDDEMYMENSINSLEMLLHDPVDSTAQLWGLTVLMDQLAAAEGAPSNFYYSAVAPGPSEDGTAGITPGIGAMVNANLWLGGALGTAETVVHEMGHSQGMLHVDCPSTVEQMPPFENYPYADGRIGVTGFGLRDFRLYRAEYSDNYMAYCFKDNFTSDYNFNKFWNRIQSLSAQGTVAPPRPVLRGLIEPDGTEHWWTRRAVINPENLSGNHSFEFEVGGQVMATELADVAPVNEPGSYWMTIPLPEGAEIGELTIRRTSFGETRSVDVPMDKLFHTVLPRSEEDFLADFDPVPRAERVSFAEGLARAVSRQRMARDSRDDSGPKR
jgi:hypothetical protein